MPAPVFRSQVESRLHVEKIARVKPPSYELPQEIKKLLGDGKYGQSVSSSEDSTLVIITIIIATCELIDGCVLAL